MNNKKSTESEYDRIINLFKDEKGLITATLIREKGIARDQDSKYRRNLLRQVIDRKEHAAWSNGRESTDNKYGIYFNIDDSSDDYLFTPYFLFELSEIKFSLQILIPNELSVDQLKLLNHFQVEYVETCKAFCRYQEEGNIQKTDFPDIWSKDIKDYIFLMTNRYIKMYKIIKMGWQQIRECHFKSDNSPDLTYDDLFRTILHDSFIREFNNSISLSNNNVQYQSRYNYFVEITKARKIGVFTPDQYNSDTVDEKADLERAMTLVSKNLGAEDWQGYFTSGIWIQECLKQSDIPLVQMALKEWQQSETDFCVFVTKLCRRASRSKENRPAGGWTSEGIWISDLAEAIKKE
jgi:hypothetical protein